MLFFILAPNGLRYPLVGGTRWSRFNRIGLGI